jgi:hypothetical protein
VVCVPALEETRALDELWASQRAVFGAGGPAPPGGPPTALSFNR